MLELLAGATVAVALLLFVLEPLVRPAPELPPEEEEPTPLEESESPKVRALLALKDVEFDQATGKLSDEDYQQLKARYQTEALAAMKEEEQEAPLPAPRSPAPADPAEALIARARAALPAACPKCGTAAEPGATFCSECGHALAA